MIKKVLVFFFASALTLDCLYQVHPINRGLINQANSCYMNAALQCITHVEPLTSYLKAHPAQFQKLNKTKEFITLINNLRDTAGQQNPSAITPYNPKNFYTTSFVGDKYSQQDSSEFLIPLLDDINTADTTPSIIQKIFGFKQISRLTCPKCGETSDTAEEILEMLDNGDFVVKSVKNTLELPLVSGAKVDLQKLLENYFTIEVLDNENKWQCSKCHQYVNATKQLLLGDTPQFLIIILKRFANVNQKDGRPIIFPRENLNIKPFTTSHEDALYNLIGITIHHGVAGGGHYFAYCKDFENNQWYNFDDRTVSFADTIIEKICNQTEDPGGPYILFYQKQTVPPKPFVEPEIPKPEPSAPPKPLAPAEIDDDLRLNLTTLKTPTYLKEPLLQSLLSNPQNYFSKTKNGETPLHLFIEYLSFLKDSESEIEKEMVNEIVTGEITKDDALQELNPPTYFNYFKFLIHNFDVNAQLPDTQETLLHLLFKKNDLQEFINNNAKRHGFHTSYHFEELLKMLMGSPTLNINLTDKDGKSAFSLIIENLPVNEQSETLAYQLIQDYKVHIDIPSYNKRNILHLLMNQEAKNQKPANNLLTFLLDELTPENFSNHTKDVNKGLCDLIKAQDAFDKTPLHYALEKNNIGGAKMLIELLYKNRQARKSFFLLTNDSGKSLETLINEKGLNAFKNQKETEHPDQAIDVNEDYIKRFLGQTFQSLARNKSLHKKIIQAVIDGKFKSNDLAKIIYAKITKATSEPTKEIVLNAIRDTIIEIISTQPEDLAGKLSTLQKKLNDLKLKLKNLNSTLKTFQASFVKKPK